MVIPAAVSLSAGLAGLYALVIVVWYELLRSQVANRLRRRRRAGVRARAAVPREPTHLDARAAENARAGQNGRAGENGLAGQNGRAGGNGLAGENGRAGGNGHTAADPAGPDGQELDRARRYFYRARQAAQAERDAAIAAANDAAQEAIGRIERRYREIDGAFVEQETERISEMLLRPPIDAADGSR